MQRKPGDDSAGRREKSNFSQTCNLLSQYIKEKGNLRDMVIEMMSPRAPLQNGKGKSEVSRNSAEQARKTVVLPDLNAATGDGKAPQMTIFYGGKVMVFDNLPEEKVKEVIAMASAEQTSGCSPSTSGAAKPDKARVEQQRNQYAPVSSADLPIARRVSLNRFLEKRKGRISSKVPYQFQEQPPADSPSSSNPQEEKPQPPSQDDASSWLGLAPSAPSSSSERQRRE